MKTLLQDVKAFHDACDIPTASEPLVPPVERAILRINLIEEELSQELLPALTAGDLPLIADSIADTIYVLVGTALEYGIPLDRVWTAVQAANMAKINTTTGKVFRREDGKILKPDGWTPPDIAAILAQNRT